VDRTDAVIVEDGAIFQQEGRIVDVGSFAELSRKHRADAVVGSERTVVLPGFVNSHHHVGLTPFQLGAPDLPLELWIAARFACRAVDPYLDTLYSAFEMIASGITTVQHIHGRVVGSVDRIEHAAAEVIRGYQDVGMRVSYSFGIRDQNRLVYEADEDFVKRLPPDLSAQVADLLKHHSLPLEDNFQLFESLTRRFHGDPRVRIQFAPANLQWCSDHALTRIAEESGRHEAPMHIHLVETPYQKEYARRRTGTTALQHLHRLGLLGPRLTLGHGTWLNEADIDLAAETGTCVCTNGSSNLRLRSGIAPVNAFERKGVRVALGIDEAGINDDRDMLQEMRLVMRVHRTPGMDDDVPTSNQILRMATEHGAHTTPFGAAIGTIEPGKSADLVVFDWDALRYPYLDDVVSVIDAVVHRAKTTAVKTVFVAGEAVYCDGQFTRVNRDDVLAELAQRMNAPLTEGEQRNRVLAKKILLHVRRFYDGYLEGVRRDPFYRPNSRD
jgi:cytosine/adenosine deaminase-related metal-dependent hydrolase